MKSKDVHVHLSVPKVDCTTTLELTWFHWKEPTKSHEIQQNKLHYFWWGQRSIALSELKSRICENKK